MQPLDILSLSDPLRLPMEEPTTPTTSSSNSSSNSNSNSNSSSTSSSNASTKPTLSLKENGSNTGNPKKRQRSSEGKHPVYRGVRMRSWGKWVSEIREPRKKSRIWLGTYSDPEMAARAHDVAALAIKGPNAHLNFPSLAPMLPKPASTCPKDVQVAAAQAAAPEFMEPIHEKSSTTSSAGHRDGNSSSSSAGHEDELFNLPDILLDLRDGLGFRFGFGMSEAISTWASNEEIQYQFEEPLLWEY
ncbi:hypothetical protein LUZ62_058307 [Rhynchospora pubera]|uniref:AP2/ERF domain-containing protein n=1 Tax=Rhynchospora pubera TaxID=906938 RepID=A0AAV8DXW9_9POAL|nr:hypothetical protein LUZ62_058307 [Rhynchospora pubera]